MIDAGLMRRMWPHANQSLIDGIVEKAPEVFAKYGLTVPTVVAQAMAQFSHECGAGTEMVENLDYSAAALVRVWPTRFDERRATELQHQPHAIANAVYNGRMGNRIGTEDGWNFRGRGLSQVTGRNGYMQLGTKVGLDLIGNPDLVNDPVNSLECGVADFVLCGCLPFAEADDIFNVTRRLNGGTIGLTDRKVWLVRWKKELR